MLYKLKLVQHIFGILSKFFICIQELGDYYISNNDIFTSFGINPISIIMSVWVTYI